MFQFPTLISPLSKFRGFVTIKIRTWWIDNTFGLWMHRHRELDKISRDCRSRTRLQVHGPKTLCNTSIEFTYWPPSWSSVATESTLKSVIVEGGSGVTRLSVYRGRCCPVSKMCVSGLVESVIHLGNCICVRTDVISQWLVRFSWWDSVRVEIFTKLHSMWGLCIDDKYSPHTNSYVNSY